MRILGIKFGAMLATALLAGCGQQGGKAEINSDAALCPNLAEVGKGNRAYEEASRCVRVMAARYSVSGDSATDVATAAIEFCRDRKISPVVDDETDPVSRQKLMESIEGGLREKAIRTVVEMRAGQCFRKSGLFDGILEPINKP